MSNIIRLPGLIDPHVHLRDLGQEQKEDFTTGTSAALAGGFTTVVDMPNNLEPITSSDRLEHKMDVAKNKIVSDIGFYFGTLGDNLSEFEKVKDRVIGLKIYLNQTTGNFLLDKSHLVEIFEKWPKELPILFHAENETFDEVLEIVKKHPRKIHLCHMSTQYELEKVIEAKKEGLPVTCGVTPHHLFLTSDDEEALGGYGKMKPPLSSKDDVSFLWHHLSDIDLIESDHAPHTKEEKESEPPAFGVTGLETTLPMLLTVLSFGKITIDDIKRLCHDGPAKIFNIKQDDGTYIEVDPEEEWTIENNTLQTKQQWTPFHGREVKGKVKRVFIRGTKVFEEGKILVAPGFGKIITA